jgi:RNA polymerase sigma factor (sigma-70 family)
MHAMKKRRPLRIEALEARETPDVSLGHGAAYPVQSLPATVPGIHEQSPLAPQISSTALQAVAPSRPAVENVTALLEQALAASRALTPQALERFFHSFTELDQLLNGFSSSTSSATSAEARESGWQFIRNYTRKAIRNDESRFGAVVDHEDIVHQVYVEWSEQAGSQDRAFTDVLQKDSPSRQILRKMVRRVLDRVRYQQGRAQKNVEFVDQPTPVAANTQEWLDMQIDLSQGVGGLNPQERRTLELRGQGMTFEEIGSELGLLKQRVFEIYHAAIDRLQQVYA